MMNLRPPRLALLLLLCALALPACERKPAATGGAQPAAGTPALPAALFVTSPPAGAREVAELKADASAAGPVVVRGRIAGRENPFVKGAAVFLLADSSIRACNENEGDACTTPWDFCCEPAENIAAATITVQVVDADGRPLRIDLAGQNGLRPLAHVTLAGEVAQRDAAGTLVINARNIYVDSGN